MTALSGLRVLELSNERISLAGKLMADMGADVILIEPPGGDPALTSDDVSSEDDDLLIVRRIERELDSDSEDGDGSGDGSDGSTDGRDEDPVDDDPEPTDDPTCFLNTTEWKRYYDVHENILAAEDIKPM